jgi:hypothetical protein
MALYFFYIVNPRTTSPRVYDADCASDRAAEDYAHVLMGTLSEPSEIVEIWRGNRLVKWLDQEP